MRRIMLIVLLGKMVSAIVMAGCGSKSTTRSTAPAGTQPSATSPASDSTSHPTSTNAEVKITDFAFTPQNLTVKAETKVTWTNDGATVHTVTFSDFGSGQLQSGEKYSNTFNQVGEFDYKCSLHPSDMTGKVIVQ